MKIYFSVWGYCDPSRVGYDTVGVSFHGIEKPSPFAGIGSTQVYEVEVPDTLIKEEVKELGKKAVAYMEKTKNYNPGYAVRKILAGEVE